MPLALSRTLRTMPATAPRPPRPIIVSINRLAGGPGIAGAVLHRHTTIGAGLRYAERMNNYQRAARPGLGQDVVSVHVVDPAADLDGDKLLAGHGRRIVVDGPLSAGIAEPGPESRPGVPAQIAQGPTAGASRGAEAPGHAPHVYGRPRAITPQLG